MTAPEPARLSENEREALGRLIGRLLGCTHKGSFDGHQMCGEHHYRWLSTGECPVQEHVADGLLDHLTARRAADAATIADLRDRLAAVEALRATAARSVHGRLSLADDLRRVLAGEGGEG